MAIYSLAGTKVFIGTSAVIDFTSETTAATAFAADTYTEVGECETISDFGDTAEYGAYVHYGANGRAPRPWVQLVAQQWQEIVSAKAAEVKKRLGL